MTHPPYACPACHHELRKEGETWRCHGCGKVYPIRDRLPILIADTNLDPFKGEEQAFHDEISRTAPPRGLVSRNSSFHWHFLNPMRRLPEGTNVLEVACGTRADGIEIAKTGKNVSSIDLSPVSVAKSRWLASGAGVGDRMRFAVADAEHLPFTDNSFDAVFIAASFHHMPHQVQALKELARVVKPGGLVIWGIEPAQWPYRTVYRWLRPVKKFIRENRSREHNSVADDNTEGYTKPMIRQIFRDAGLNIVEVRRIKYLGSLYEQFIRFLGRLMHRPIGTWRTVDHALAYIDDGIRFIPGFNMLNWHFNVISRKP